MRRLLVQLRAVVVKEARQTVRDRRMLFMLLVAPVFQLVMLGYAVNLDVDHVPTVVVDQDRTPTSREHLRGLLADGTLEETARADGVAEANRLLDAGEASVAVVIPRGFTRDLARGEPAPVQVLLDGSDPNRSNIAGAAASQYFQGAALDVVRGRLERLSAAMGRRVSFGTIDARPRIFYNPRLDSAIFMVPGVAVLVLILATTVVTAMGIAREREVGTLEQVLVTPISPGVLMAGKALPFVAVGLIDVTTALTVSAWVFDLPIRGSLAFLGVATLFYLMTTLGVGLFISTVSETQQQAFMGGVFFILPAILLSGIFTPISSMPAWMRALTWLNPVRYYIEILRAVLLKAAGPADLALQTGALFAYGLAIIGLASLRFRKRLR